MTLFSVNHHNKHWGCYNPTPLRKSRPEIWGGKGLLNKQRENFLFHWLRFVCCWYSVPFFSRNLNYTSILVKINFVEKEKIYNFANWSVVQNRIIFEIKATEQLRVLEKFRNSVIFKLGWDSSLFFSKFFHWTQKYPKRKVGGF